MLQKLSSVNETLKGHELLLLTPKAPQAAIDKIKTRFPDLKVSYYQTALFEKTEDPEGKDIWADATIALTLTKFPKPEQAPKLELVQLISAGANHAFDEPIYKDTEVSFCTANGVHGPQISEWVIGTFLSFQHSFAQYLENQRQAKWKRLTAPVYDAVGQRVGILGYGGIGRQVARVSKAMGMDVHAYTLHPRSTPESRKDRSYAPPGLGDPDGTLPSKWYSGGSTKELHDFLGSDLDLLVVCLPLTDKTKNLIGKAEFEVLSKKKAFLSNVARGPIINTSDLKNALENDVIRGAAIDVTDPEPLPDGHELWSTKNLVITPHISGNSAVYLERAMDVLYENLERFSKGKPLMNLVSRKDGY